MNFILADICIRLNVACKAYDRSVIIPRNKWSDKIISLLYQQGIINSFSIKNNDLLVVLKYINSKPFIKTIKLISKPGKRVYWSLYNLSRNYNANALNSFYIISNPNGLLLGSDNLLLYKGGGEIIMKVELF